MTEAYKTPVADLLDKVPEDIVLGIPGNEPVFQSYHNIPIGQLAKEAATELRRLHTLNQELLEALKDPRSRYGYGNEDADYRAAIAKAEGEKQ